MIDNFINMIWLYPDLFQLHGDRGNIMAFERVAKLAGLRLNIKKVENLTEKLDLEGIDIIFANPGELGTVLNAIKALDNVRDQILEYVNSGKYIITIGTTGAMLSKKIYTADEKEHYGLGILDMECRQRKTVVGNDLHFTLNNSQEIIGSQIQMLDFTVSNEHALGEITYGYGNDGNGLEGAKNNNAIFTNALGPVFVKNPWWVENILSEIANKKGVNTREISIDNYELEIKSFNSTKRFLKEKISKKE